MPRAGCWLADGSQPVQPQHPDSSASALLVPRDELPEEIGRLRRWVPMGTGHGGCNEGGISGEASPEIGAGTSRTFGCSSIHQTLLVLVLCPRLQEQGKTGRTLTPGGQILMDLGSAAHLPAAQGPRWQNPPGRDAPNTTWRTLRPTLPRHRQG